MVKRKNHSTAIKFLLTGFLIFSIAFLAATSSAQTTICKGDSVILLLNGYNKGIIVWQQSSDQITWSNASGTAYNDSIILIATTTNYYRAVVTEAGCNPFYSDTVLVTVRPVPPPPTANPASAITLFSFDANWSAVADATTYYLDVATDAGFTSIVTSCNNRKVNNKTTSTITGIFCDTTYYYRVRVYDNTCGTTSDNSNVIAVATPVCPVYCTYKSACNGNITDTRDSKIYKTIQIGSQCWMAQNLNVGAVTIASLQQTPGADNQNLSIEKYCFGDNANNCIPYGGLYLWDEMMAYGLSTTTAPGPRGICPVDWHLPTDNEWKCLEMTLGMDQTSADQIGFRDTSVGGKLKDTSSLWKTPNLRASNKSGFAALPSGSRSAGGTVGGQGDGDYFWTATEENGALAVYRQLSYNITTVFRGNLYDFRATGGFSVRCVKN